MEVELSIWDMITFHDVMFVVWLETMILSLGALAIGATDQWFDRRYGPDTHP